MYSPAHAFKQTLKEVESTALKVFPLVIAEQRAEMMAAWEQTRTAVDAEFSKPEWKPVDPAQTNLPGV